MQKKTQKKMWLTEQEHKAVQKVLKIKDFDEALRATPESVLDKLFEMTGGREGECDFFAEDLFPNGPPEPLSPEEFKKLVEKIDRQ